MRRPIQTQRQTDEDQAEPDQRRHPRLRRLIVVNPVHIVDIHDRIRIAFRSRRGRHQEISDEHQDRRNRRPTGERPPIVAETPHGIQQQQRQPEVKKRHARK